MSASLSSTPSGFLGSLLAALQGAAVVGYAVCQAALVMYASHRWGLLWMRRPLRPETPPAPEAWPRVTVQLPLYNERLVVERAIDAAAALDYPRERLQIQVLDDSTDDTSSHAAAAVRRHRARGLDIVHLRRERREGYKAGALAAGLARASGSLVAVFDADFVPPPEFLRRLVPHFADAGVGMVQARWTHLNRDRSALTSAEAVLLDAHFLLEHTARMRRGLFLNFNGTAGIWRRDCIEDAGGWSSDTLTEDLDLSYRAQLAGWRFVFDDRVAVPAELPGEMEAFKSQQRRWTKGSIQTARKLLPEVWRRPLPAGVKREAFFHLTSNVAYPLLLVLSLLLLPVMLARSLVPAWAVWTLHAGVLLFGIVPVALFLAAGQRAAGASWRALPRHVAGALVLGVGLSVNNARAVLEGLGSGLGDWERTPKTGDGVRERPLRAYPAAHRAAGRGELVLALYFASLLAWAAAAGQWRAVPFLLLLVSGFTWVGAASRQDSRRSPGTPLSPLHRPGAGTFAPPRG